MSGLPYYKRYPRDFLDGTAGMPFELKCAYSVVLDLIYIQRGKLPDDPHYISGHLGCSVRKWNLIREKLLEAGKIKAENGVISNLRADKEEIILSKYQDKQRENRRGVNKNNDLQKIRSDQPEPEPDTLTNVSDGEPSKVQALPMDVSVVSAALWAAGTRYFLGQGFSEKQARSMIGMFLKKHKPEEVLSAIEAARKSGTQDPVPYITEALKPQQTEWEKNRAKREEEKKNREFTQAYYRQKEQEPDLTMHEYIQRVGRP